MSAGTKETLCPLLHNVYFQSGFIFTQMRVTDPTAAPSMQVTQHCDCETCCYVSLGQIKIIHLSVGNTYTLS